MELNFTNGNLGKCTTNVEVALEVKFNQKIQKIHQLRQRSPVRRSYWVFGRHGTSTRAGHNLRARVLRSSSCHAEFRANPAKP